LPACATRRPVLYPNEQLQRAGTEGARQDVDDCLAQAEAYVGGGSRAAKTAGQTATGAAVGGAVGAAGGAVVGHAGRGAGVGAATGGTAALLHGILGSRDPDPMVKRYVERCLRDRGYETLGWR
jgi:hypothetical protein